MNSVSLSWLQKLGNMFRYFHPFSFHWTFFPYFNNKKHVNSSSTPTCEMFFTAWEDDLSSIKNQWTLKLSTSWSGDLRREQRLPALVLMLSKKLEGCRLWLVKDCRWFQMETHKNTWPRDSGVFSVGRLLPWMKIPWTQRAQADYVASKTPMPQKVEHCSCIGSKAIVWYAETEESLVYWTLKWKHKQLEFSTKWMTWFSCLFVSIVLCFEMTFQCCLLSCHASTGLSSTRFWWLLTETMLTARTTLRPKHMVQEMILRSTHLFWFIVFIDRKDVLDMQNP